MVDVAGRHDLSENTFFVVFPDDEELEWAISVHTRRGLLGGYEIEREDPRTGEHTTTTVADPFRNTPGWAGVSQEPSLAVSASPSSDFNRKKVRRVWSRWAALGW
ncbi:hypothetical protein [Promicromonospora umidemergens]|uniref:Uncharacterized protein n=1 Tax=Promicromonospora umidemergens TaxID=629679 RepID=A0ABP8WYM0_9MICO|nr:hypothetical protein [Promicromonospora umidemergens]